jgi:predicted nucleic acid-binding protein
VVLESNALLQRRLGTDAVGHFHRSLLPGLQVTWVSEELHRAAVAAQLEGGRRRVSLVDHTSFEVMRRESLEAAFAFDAGFAHQGFSTIP